jgi:hypothetical protein
MGNMSTALGGEITIQEGTLLGVKVRFPLARGIEKRVVLTGVERLDAG